MGFGGLGFVSRMIDQLNGDKALLKRTSYFSRSKASLDQKNSSLSMSNETKEKIRKRNRRSTIVGAVARIGFIAVLILTLLFLYILGR